jgi:uncharacterized protein GlcG (DUF336 family)
MNKIWGAVALVGCMVLWSGALVWADDNDDPQREEAGLTIAQARTLFHACQKTAATTPSPLRKTPGTKMWCAVVDREGEILLIQATDTGGTPAAPGGSDAWRGSIEIAIAKAYTAVAFSSNDLALDSKTIGLLARPDGPGSTAAAAIGTNAGVASLFGIGNTNLYRPLTGEGLATTGRANATMASSPSPAASRSTGAAVSCWVRSGSAGTAWMRMTRWRKGPSQEQASVRHPNRQASARVLRERSLLAFPPPHTHASPAPDGTLTASMCLREPV